MEISSYTAWILLLVYLTRLSTFPVDASSPYPTNSTKPSKQGETKPILTTKATTVTSTEARTTVSTTGTMNITRTIEHSSEASLVNSMEQPPQLNTYNHDEHEHKVMFYTSVCMGSLLATVLLSLFIILVTRSIRKKREKKRKAHHLAKINRACQSQYVPNEEVSSNNPMYEGSRYRTTSNVLYGVPEEENGRSQFYCRNDYISTPPNQESPKVDVVIRNSCALYQRADDLYSEPGKVPEERDNGNYERIRSFHYENSGVRQSTGSYVEPHVLINGMFISENNGYISAAPKNK